MNLFLYFIIYELNQIAIVLIVLLVFGLIHSGYTCTNCGKSQDAQ